MTNEHKPDFSNVYEDTIRAESYATLTFDKTYYLAYRDLPMIISQYVSGKNALDFGCGTGRSTRFLKNLGFTTTGVDISEEMIRIARKLDPTGTYYRIDDGDFSILSKSSFDLILSAFTFDNIPTMEHKISLLKGLSTLLHSKGTIINLVSSPEIYTHEWASFTTKDFPENTSAKTGDLVRIITTDISDKRPCDDIFITEKDYATVYTNASLHIMSKHKPLATGKELYQWVNETHLAPWTIYVLRKKT